MRRKESIIVTLTSYPKRIRIVHKVIESLWKQTVCADQIILYLSSLEFPQREANLPQELCKMIGEKGFQIEWVEGNLKSHKKYYYALKRYCDDIVITVDDDIEYADTLISDLLGSYQKFPNVVSARRARIVLKNGGRLEPYQEWDVYLNQCANSPRMDLCAIGAGGVLYPPHCATSKWFDEEKIIQLAENQDDLWLKYNEIVGKIEVVYVNPTQKDQPIESAKETALSIKNLYSRENDMSIGRLCGDIKTYFPQLYACWIDGLMTKEEYILQKKNYYFAYIRKEISEIKEGPIYLYGAGKRAETFIRIFSESKMISKLEALIVSDKRKNPQELLGIKIKQLDEVDKNELFNVILGVGDIYRAEVEEKLTDFNCRCFNFDVQGILHYYEENT